MIRTSTSSKIEPTRAASVGSAARIYFGKTLDQLTPAEAAMLAGLPNAVPAETINRFCSSGLNAVSIAADRIRTGLLEQGIVLEDKPGGITEWRRA